MRFDLCWGRKSLATPVHPDTRHAHFLRPADIMLKVVAYHPGLHGSYVKRLQHIIEGAFVRFSDAELAFDLDVLEIRRQGEAADLGALQF